MRGSGERTHLEGYAWLPFRRKSLTQRAVLGAVPCVAVTVLLLVCAPAASGRAPKEESPVARHAVTVTAAASEPGAPIDEELTGLNHVVAGSGPALQSAGIRWARTDVSFEITTGSGPAYDCATGVWNPTYLDSQVALDQSAGATPELIVDYTPPCLATDPPNGVNPNYTPPDIGADQAKWQALVYQMALHEITDEGVRAFEVWNEPNLGEFWTGGLSGYLTLYRDTAQSLEEAAAQAGVAIEVGGPALGEFNGLDTSWITALASYVRDQPAPPGLRLVAPLRQQPRPRSERYVPGRSVRDGDPSGRPALLQPGPQCRPLRSADPSGQGGAGSVHRGGPAPVDRRVEHQRRRGRPDRRTVRRRLRGRGPRPGPGGRSRPHVFLRHRRQRQRSHPELGTAQRRPHPQTRLLRHADVAPAVGVPATGDRAVERVRNHGVGAVASTAPDGTVHVMVYDFAPYDPNGLYGTSDPTPYDHPVTIKLVGLPRGVYDVDRTLIDATHDGTVISSAAIRGPSHRVRFTLAGEGVTLLTVTPSSGS